MLVTRWLWVAMISLAVIGCESGEEGIVPPEAWTLVMADEFDGPAGTTPNPALWSYDIGGGGWGNNQLEFDTNRIENVTLDGEGNLRIIARQESFMGNDYTSGRIKTLGLFAQKYGRFEARIKLPEGQGIWPAFWMLGTDFPTIGWPQAGEIDIMEFRGQAPELVHASLHGPGYSGGEPITATFRLPDGETFVDDFHVFAVEWDPGRITFSVDSEVFKIINTSDVTARGPWVFDHEFFILLNLAVGGSFVGPVGPQTVFPAEMVIDYVRVFERAQ